ncbi:MAG: hypothetical protein LBV42_04770 [Methanobrevibacter sp.]|jgi:hypothetical protein|nr:hypothetical protein [Methanobrevibacter sp.]
MFLVINLIFISKSYSKKIIFIPILIFNIFGMINSADFINSQNHVKSTDMEFKEFLNQMNKNGTIITDDKMGIMPFYLREK